MKKNSLALSFFLFKCSLSFATGRHTTINNNCAGATSAVNDYIYECIVSGTYIPGSSVNTSESLIINTTPSITSFSPSNGPVGTLVTIVGTNLNTTTAFSIGGVSAIVVSDTSVIAGNSGDTL